MWSNYGAPSVYLQARSASLRGPLRSFTAWAVLVPPDSAASQLDRAAALRSASGSSAAISVFARTQPTHVDTGTLVAIPDDPDAVTAVTARAAEAVAYPIVALGAMHTLRHGLLGSFVALQRPISDAEAQVCRARVDAPFSTRCGT